VPAATSVPGRPGRNGQHRPRPASRPDLLTSAIHTKVKSSLIMRLSCGNTLKSIRGAAPFGCGANQAFPQVIRSARSRS
jgi:hypothetical protein